MFVKSSLRIYYAVQGHSRSNRFWYFEKEKRALEIEAEKERRAHELEMKRLELAAQSGTASADDRRQAPAFRIDTAVKLIPKFNEHWGFMGLIVR